MAMVMELIVSFRPTERDIVVWLSVVCVAINAPNSHLVMVR